MTGFVLLHLKRLFDHPGRLFMAVVGVAAGTSLVVAVLGVHTSITASVAELSELGGDADLEVSPVTDVGLDAATLDGVETIDGVAFVAPLVRTSIAVEGEVLLLIGADGRATAFGGPIADEPDVSIEGPADSDGVDLDGLFLTRTAASLLDVAPGDELDVYANAGGARSDRLAGTLAVPRIDSINGGRIAFATLAHAQELVGRGNMIDTILVRTQPGASVSAVQDGIRDALGPGVLVEDRAARQERVAAPAITYLSQVGPVAGMGLVVGAFLVFSTMNMAAIERRRELATLRTLGAGRTRLVGGLVGEAAVLGMIGSTVGVAAGTFLARAVVGQLPAAMEQAIGVRVTFSLPAAALPLALLLGIGASTAAALIPALRATSAHPLEALRPAGTLAAGGERLGIAWPALTTGVAVAAIGLVVLVSVRGDRAAGGILLLAVGGVVASYALAGPIARLAGRITRLGGGLGHLAATGVERSPHRVWATSMAVALAVAMTLAVASGARNQLDLDAEHLSTLRDTDLIVSAHPLDQLAIDVYLPDRLIDEIRAIDGVAAAGTLTTQAAVLDNRNFLVYGIDTAPGRSAFPGIDLASAEAQTATLGGRGIVVSHQFAREFDLEEGDVAEIPGSRGVLRLPVVDIVHTLAVSDNGMVLVSDEQLRTVFGTRGISSIDVTLEDDADAGAVRAAIEDRNPDALFPMTVGTGEESYQAIIGGIVAVQRVMYGVLVVTGGVAALAVLNTLVASVLDRTRELGVLRAVGTTPRQLAAIIGLEAAGVGVTGASVGLIIGEAVHWGGVRYIGNASPLPVEFAFVPEIVVIAALVGIAATVAGSLVPIRRASRIDVLDAIAWE